MENNTPLIQYTTVSDSVYLWIKNAIIQGDFKPGGTYRPGNPDEKTGSQPHTSIWDAIKRLEAEGLLITKPHCGAVVFQLSRENLNEIYEVRILMEQYCATRTCMKASDEEINAIEAINLRMLSFSNTSKEFMQLDRQFHSLLCTLSAAPIR